MKIKLYQQEVKAVVGSRYYNEDHWRFTKSQLFVQVMELVPYKNVM